jgi:hypothetical protein
MPSMHPISSLARLCLSLYALGRKVESLPRIITANGRGIVILPACRPGLPMPAYAPLHSQYEGI